MQSKIKTKVRYNRKEKNGETSTWVKQTLYHQQHTLHYHLMIYTKFGNLTLRIHFLHHLGNSYTKQEVYPWAHPDHQVMRFAYAHIMNIYYQKN